MGQIDKSDRENKIEKNNIYNNILFLNKDKIRIHKKNIYNLKC